MDFIPLIAIVSIVLAFELAAQYFGVDSTDGPGSVEWERRRNWPGLTGY